MIRRVDGFRTFIPALSALLLSSCLASATSYDAYSTAVNGGARHIGLAGSNIAYPDGYAGLFINPAGLGRSVFGLVADRLFQTEAL